MNKVLLSSDRMDWETPEQVYNILHDEFRFTFYPCPRDPQFDGLAIRWKVCNYVNPPYGRRIGDWIRKGFEEWKRGNTVVFLIPSRTDTKYWHEYIMRASEIRFVKGRIKFKGAEHGAPFPSAVVVFDVVRESPLISSVEYPRA